MPRSDSAIARNRQRAREKYAANPEIERNRLREYNSRPEIKERRSADVKRYRLVHGDRLRAENLVYRAEQRLVKPWQKLLQGSRARARAKGLPFDLTAEWMKARYTGRCEITGIEFVPATGRGPRAFSPSIDRIVPSKGYTMDNCRFIVFAVNAIRGTMTDGEMFELAARLVSVRPVEAPQAKPEGTGLDMLKPMNGSAPKHARAAGPFPPAVRKVWACLK